MQALEVFVEKQGKLPTPGSKADIAAFVSVFEELNASMVRSSGAPVAHKLSPTRTGVLFAPADHRGSL